MQVQREFEPAIAQKLETVPIEKLREILEVKPEQENAEPSKWAKYAERIHRESPLRGASEYVLKCSKEFRENFEFKHDQE